MPRYSYVCEKCKQTFSITHSMSEKIETYEHDECPDGGKLRKVPSVFCKQIVKEKKTGQIVKKYIEDAKREVKEEKQALKKKEYKEDNPR